MLLYVLYIKKTLKISIPIVGFLTLNNPIFSAETLFLLLILMFFRILGIFVSNFRYCVFAMGSGGAGCGVLYMI